MRSSFITSTRALPIVATLVVSITACTPRQETERDTTKDQAEDPMATLTGTGWQLVEFQSMSDETGIVRPPDPTVYTLSLGSDGAVSMRLNCNQGQGTWSATPSGAAGGQIEFGPIAATRALCPPPSMDEQIARDFAFVRSYTIEGDRLYLSLEADAGIYVWERLATTEQTLDE